MNSPNISMLTATLTAALLLGSCAAGSATMPFAAAARFQKAPSAPSKDDPRLLLDPTEEESFGLTYWIELNDASGAPAEKVSDQRVFKSGDRIRLHFKATANGTVSIIQIAANGTSNVLFPNAARHLTDDALRAGIERPLPVSEAGSSSTRMRALKRFWSSSPGTAPSWTANFRPVRRWTRVRRRF